MHIRTAQYYPKSFGILTTIWPNLALTKTNSRSSNSFTNLFWQIFSISAGPAWKTTLQIIEFVQEWAFYKKNKYLFIIS